MRILTLITVSLLFLITQITCIDSNLCHYTCITCTQKFHQFCKICQSGLTLNMVHDSFSIPAQYQLQNQQIYDVTGACSAEPDLPSYNIFGIFTLILMSIAISLSRSKLLFHIGSVLQSVGLLYFIEVGWLGPIRYVLDGLLYFMPCNIVTKRVKESTWEINKYSYNQINSYFIQPQLHRSFTLLGPINLCIIFLIITIQFARFLKRKYFADKCRAIICFNAWIIDSVIGFLNCLFYFLIQESILCFVVAFKFTPVVERFEIGSVVGYGIALAYFIGSIFWFKIQFFYNVLDQYYCLVKKTVFPLFVILPFGAHFFLIIIMESASLFQIFLDYKLKSYTLKSRNSIFKLLQTLLILFFGIYYGINSALVSSTTSVVPVNNKSLKAMSIILTIFLSLIIVLFIVQALFTIKDRINQSNQKKVFTTTDIVNQSNNESNVNNNSIPNKITNINNTSVQNMQVQRMSTQQTFIAESSVPPIYQFQNKDVDLRNNRQSKMTHQTEYKDHDDKNDNKMEESHHAEPVKLKQEGETKSEALKSGKNRRRKQRNKGIQSSLM